MAVAFLLVSHPSFVLGQGTKITMEHDPVVDTDRDKPGEREQWFTRGRTLPGQATAALRYQAHLRKMQMRAARKAALQMQGIAALSAVSGSWTPLGPAPLASDATGFGGQDYGAVSGRTTSVAVDPADPSGNTVYVGGAYGGVWKSSNAGTSIRQMLRGRH
jgi:large repetitive protein